MNRTYCRTPWLICAAISLLVALFALGAGLSCENRPTGDLAFSSVREGNSDIYIISADGTELRRVTSVPTRELEPCWSPDANRIAYQSRRPNWMIFTSQLDGADEQQVSTSLSWSPDWSPGGEWIAYSTGSAIYRTSLAGEGSELLTQGGNCGRPNWSPDGRAIAFHSTRSGDNEIYILWLEDGTIQRITEHPARDFHVNWSPGGERIVFASDRDGDLEIYTVCADGTDLLQLTDNEVDDMLPAWSPDGRWIAFVSSRDGNREIYLMQPDGSCPIRLTDNPGDDMYPAWRPDVEPGED
jgi:Tol biopolymer transport system component